MGTVNVVLGEDTRLNLILGQQLENAVTEVVFDFSAWKTTYGTGTLALSVQRPGDDQPYAVTLTTSGTDATWSVTNLDTAYKGVGHIQLTYTVGSAIKKSVVYKFTVYESLGANGEYPSPGQTWQEEMEQEITDVRQDFSKISDIYNWYDPNDTYSCVQKNGNSAGDITKNNDGSWTCVGSLGQLGQRFLKSTNALKLLSPGFYNVSCRVTFHENAPSGEKQLAMCVGRANATYISVYVTTERGGNVRISGDTKTGWASTDIEVTGEEVFALECHAVSSDYASSSLPYTVDYIQVTSGKGIKEYSTDLYDAKDKLARETANNASIFSDTLKKSSKVRLILNNALTPIFSNDRKVVTFPKGPYESSEDTILYVINDGASRTSYTYSTIYSQISSYTEITDDGLVLNMPSEGFFGFDVVNKSFVVKTGFNVPENIAPLYFRYYNHCVGDLADFYIFKNSNVSENNISNILRRLKDENGLWYTTSTARHSYEAGPSGGSLTFHIGSRLNVKSFSYQSAPFNWEDIVPSGSSAYVINEDNSLDVTMSAYRSLVFNLLTGKLDIININDAAAQSKEYHIVLLTNGWSVPFKGILYDEYITRTTLDMSANAVGSDQIRNQSFNSAFHTGATGFRDKCEQFSTLMLGDTMNDITAPADMEAFLFFTDPHLLESTGWENQCYEFISQIQKYYNSTPTTFCLCGGDWLGNSDLPSSACFKMGYIDGFMHSMFDNCYMLVGNHDTNYQGKKDAESERYTTRLSNQSIVDLWYREGKKAYYSFEGANTKFYCFDTGIEGQQLTTFDNYGWEQAEWFATELLTETAEHIAIASHILYYATDVLQPLTSKVLDIAKAYNDKGSISVNGTTYDYSSATGKVEFGIFGHKHTDEDHYINGIPCVMTLNVRNNTSLGASFDLVFVDYDNRDIQLVRVGSGEDRTIDLDEPTS